MEKEYSDEIKRNIDLFWIMEGITNRTDKAVVSKWSSANFWGFGDTVDNEVYLTFPRGYNLKLSNDFISTQRAAERYSDGIKVVEYKSQKLKVYEPERTVVEMIKDAKGIYDDILLQAIKNFFKRINYSPEKLDKWAKIFKIPGIVHQFEVISHAW